MKLKNKTKFLLVLGIVFVAFLLFNTNNVNAVDITDQYMQNMLDVLPNELTINFKQAEAKSKSEEITNIVEQEVKEIWSKNNIEIQNVDTYFNFNLMIKENYNVFVVSIADKNYNIKNKNITIIYSDTNIEDVQYVKNIKLPSYPKFVTYNLGDEYDVLKMVENYYKSNVNDSSINIMCNYGAGGSDSYGFGFGFDGGIYIAISKNGNIYDIEHIMSADVDVVPVITIDKNVTNTDQDCINYAIQKMQNSDRYKDISNNITLTKGAQIDNTNIENGYTVKLKDTNEKIGVVILNKTNLENEDTTIEVKNESTNIKLNANTTVVPKDITLEVKEIKEEKTLNTIKESLKEISNKYVSYDITLKSNGVAIQPNGKVKISIPIPSNFDKTKLSVYRIAENGTKTKYDTKVESDFAIIETDHFSTYVLAENNVVAQTKPTQVVNKGEKDETPKTGTIDIIGYILLASVLSGLGIVALKKNLK